jgi:hypothetical protein
MIESARIMNQWPPDWLPGYAVSWLPEFSNLTSRQVRQIYRTIYLIYYETALVLFFVGL